MLDEIKTRTRSQRQRLHVLQLTQPPLQLFRREQETFNRFAGHEPIHNLGDVCNPHAPVEKVVGFD